MTKRNPYQAAESIIRDAGGCIIGRTRLQKVAYLMHIAGFENGFSFEYLHYGPYSEDLARAMEIASVLGEVQEEECDTDWGGRYSIYRLNGVIPGHSEREAFAQRAKDFSAIELELAATAAYLFIEENFREATGRRNPWNETRLRKPTKASDERLRNSAKLYDQLRSLPAPSGLPELPPIPYLIMAA